MSFYVIEKRLFSCSVAIPEFQSINIYSVLKDLTGFAVAVFIV